MIYFARHGEKAQGGFYNAALNIQDAPLSEKGQEDARRIAAFFRDIDIKRIYASEYLRAQQTAAPAAREKGLPVIADARVNEINGGDFHRMSETEFKVKYPELWHNFVNHLCDIKFPGGESGAEVKMRQNSFLDDMKKETGDILVVSHDGFIRLLLCNILGLPVYMRYKFITAMGNVSAIEHDGKEWRILRFNQAV
jgi:broad specificity phosphatase PhoE